MVEGAKVVTSQAEWEAGGYHLEFDVPWKEELSGTEVWVVEGEWPITLVRFPDNRGAICWGDEPQVGDWAPKCCGAGMDQELFLNVGDAVWTEDGRMLNADGELDDEDEE